MATDSPEKLAQAAQDDLHDMRQDYDGGAKPVDHQPGTFFSVGSLVDFEDRGKKDPKEIVVTKRGTVVELSFGKQSLSLDAEGVKNAVRVFSDLALEV